MQSGVVGRASLRSREWQANTVHATLRIDQPTHTHIHTHTHNHRPALILTPYRSNVGLVLRPHAREERVLHELHGPPKERHLLQTLLQNDLERR